MSAPRSAWLGWIESVRRKLRRPGPASGLGGATPGDMQAAQMVGLIAASFVEPPDGAPLPEAPTSLAVRLIAELGGSPPPWGAS